MGTVLKRRVIHIFVMRTFFRPDPPKTWVVAKTVIAPPTKRTKETLVKAPEKTTPKSPATEKEALKTSKEEP